MTTDEPPQRSRAVRLPPDERRAAIVAATIPLIRKYGFAVTTRQIADAAGVAEGTLFRVFEDKDALVKEAVCVALEPTGVEQRLADIDRGLPVRVRLVQAAGILQQHLQDVVELLAAIGLSRPPEAGNDAPHRPAHESLIREVESLVEPDRDAFRLPPAEVARLLRVLTFAGSHAGITGDQTLTPDEIVSVLLDGVLDTTQDPTHIRTGDSSC